MPGGAEKIWIGWKEFIYGLPSIIRGTVFGFLVGMLPGAGATLSTFIAYNLEKRICKHPERLGTGDIRGVANPESANNSAIGVWSLSYSEVDLVLTGAAGLLGYYLRRHKYPIEPLILGLILGGRMEQAYRQALIISRGSNWMFLEHPVSLALLISAALFLLLPTILKKSKQFMAARETSAEAA